MAFYYGLLFDVDGTLLNFEASEDGALRDTLAHFSLPDTEETVAAYRSINNSLWAALEQGKLRQEKLVVQRFEKLLGAIGAKEKRINPARMNEYYLAQLAQRADTFEGVEEALNELAEVATLAVVSNGVEKVQMGRLERSGLERYFDGVFISSRVGAPKPSRKIFDAALNALGIENRKKVLMVGDSLKADITGGINAGVDTCWCNFHDLPLPEGAPNPKYIIRSLKELLPIVMEEEELANVGNPEKRHQV